MRIVVLSLILAQRKDCDEGEKNNRAGHSNRADFRYEDGSVDTICWIYEGLNVSFQ